MEGFVSQQRYAAPTLILNIYKDGEIMAEIDPELRDKIIETHTLVKRMDEDHKEHKRVVNARLRDCKISFEKHKEETDEKFVLFQGHIDDAKTFRTKVVTYASIAAGAIAFFSDPVIRFIKMFFQA